MKSIGTQILQTERLILRRFVESDAEAMFQNWASSAENLTMLPGIPILMSKSLETRFAIGLLPILISTIINGPFV